MNFSDRPSLTIAQKLGCAIYILLGGLMSSFMMIGAALSDCASEGQCLSEFTRTIMFFGTPLITLIGGVFLINFFMRDEH